MPNALVCMVMGSASNLPIMPEATEMLRRFQVPYEVAVRSVPGVPQRPVALARQAVEREVPVIIAGAGRGTPWAGAIAAAALPALGAPLDVSPRCGFDTLLAAVQMPRGVPVATVALGKAGAAHAGVLAAPMMAAGKPDVGARLKPCQADLAATVERDAEVLQRRLQGL